jgi:hypothetical protein
MSFRELEKYVTPRPRSFAEENLWDLIKAYTSVFKGEWGPPEFSLVATLLWQILRRTDEYRNIVKTYNRPTREIIVPLGRRYDMLVMVPDLPADHQQDVITHDLTVTDGSAATALQRWNQYLDLSAAKGWATVPHNVRVVQRFLTPNVLADAVRSRVFHLVVIQQPPMHYTRGVPSRHMRVSAPGGDACVGLHGKLTNAEGSYKVYTTARHLLAEWNEPVPGSAAVTIDGQPATCVDDSPVYDVAFLECPKTACAGYVSQSVLSGVTPGKHEKADFIDQNGTRKTTEVNGWDESLPLVFAGKQSSIYTDPDTAQGDSGTALFRPDGATLGLAFMRTGPTAKPASRHADWIWADCIATSFKFKWW